MSKRNGTVTDEFDRLHRVVFVRSAREEAGLTRQRARHLWARRVRKADIGRKLNRLFDEVSQAIVKAEGRP